MPVSNLPLRLIFAIFVFAVCGIAYRNFEVEFLGDSRILERAQFVIQQAKKTEGSRRIFVVGGSTAIMGILAETIQNSVGVTTISAAISNQLFSHENTFDFASLLVKSGDVVIYQSPALLGDNQFLPINHNGDRRSIYIRRALKLKSDKFNSGYADSSPFFRLDLIPTQSVLKSIWQYYKNRRNRNSEENAGRGEFFDIARCDSRTVRAVPAKFRQKMSNQYFEHLRVFNEKMRDKGVRVYYAFPYYLVKSADDLRWAGILRESELALMEFDGFPLNVLAKEIFLHDESLFCDARHVRIKLAEIQSEFIAGELRRKEFSKSH